MANNRFDDCEVFIMFVDVVDFLMPMVIVT
jgi:hypothetical protein